MRNLFFVLVLANLGVAAWHTWYAPLTPVLHGADSTLPSITLVSEVPVDLRTAGSVNDAQLKPTAAEPTPAREAPSAPPKVTAAAPATPPAPVVITPPPPKETVVAAAPTGGDGAAGRCTTIGPFRELSQAATAAATLRTAGFEPEQRVTEGEVWSGYWVFIQAIPTKIEAEEILKKVRASGITDSYVIANTETGSLVSLGVFNEISGVSRLREKARALGFEPQVVDRTRRATVYWVEVTLHADQAVDFERLQPPGRIMRLEQRPCGSETG